MGEDEDNMKNIRVIRGPHENKMNLFGSAIAVHLFHNISIRNTP